MKVKSSNRPHDSVIIDGVRHDITTIREIGNAMSREDRGGTPTQYESQNKYAEDTCILDTPRGMAFFRIRCKLSNFYPCSIRFNGRQYISAEHAYQGEKVIAAKAFDKLHAILATPTASRAKVIGNDIPETPLWSRIKVDRMRDILNAKFRQNKPLNDYLCSIKGKDFIEANAYDSFWGAGVSLNSTEIKTGRWSGRNELGKLLTELRNDLLRERDTNKEKTKYPPPPLRRAQHTLTTGPTPLSHTDGRSNVTSTQNRYSQLEVTHISKETFDTRL